jgi:SAM-dependent methyltransferase
MTANHTIPAIQPASPWVERFAGLIRGHSDVLDLACGQGRHALLLAGLGHQVEAVDRDPVATAALRGVDGVSVTVCDLESEDWPYADRRFDAVVVTNYLFRPLLPILIDSLERGGLLIYETFMVGNEVFGSPRNPDFLLRENELLDLIKGKLDLIAFEQGKVSEPRPAMIQRLCAQSH